MPHYQATSKGGHHLTISYGLRHHSVHSTVYQRRIIYTRSMRYVTVLSKFMLLRLRLRATVECFLSRLDHVCASPKEIGMLLPGYDGEVLEAEDPISVMKGETRWLVS